MLQILVVSIFFIIAFSLMAMALHFAKWKKRGQSGCCGGTHCGTEGGGGSCHNEKVNYINEKIIKPKMMN